MGSIAGSFGKVDIARSNQPRILVHEGHDVQIGDIIQARSESWSDIRFASGHRLHLSPGARVQIVECDIGSNHGAVAIHIYRGRVQLIQPAHPDRQTPVLFEIRTPTARFTTLDGNALFHHLEGASGAVFTSGSGIAWNTQWPDQTVTGEKGVAIFITRADAPPARILITPQEFDNIGKSRPDFIPEIISFMNFGSDVTPPDDDVTPPDDDVTPPDDDVTPPDDDVTPPDDDVTPPDDDVTPPDDDVTPPDDDVTPPDDDVTPPDDDVTPPDDDVTPPDDDDTPPDDDVTPPDDDVTPPPPPVENLTISLVSQAASPGSNNQNSVSFALAANDPGAIVSWRILWHKPGALPILMGSGTTTGGTALISDFLIRDGRHELEYTAANTLKIVTQRLYFDVYRRLLTGNGDNANEIKLGGLSAVRGQAWGGWNLNLSGLVSSASNPPVLGTIFAGGKALSINGDVGYWIERFYLNASPGGALTGSGQFSCITDVGWISQTHPVSGSYSRYQNNYWGWSVPVIGVGMVETPLDYAGEWGRIGKFALEDGGNSLYHYHDPTTDIEDVGELHARIGLIQQSVSVFDFLAIGQYDFFGIASPLVMSTLLSGEQISGNGWFNGCANGIWNNGVMNGRTVALYVTDNGESGFLTGDLTGGYYTNWNGMGSYRHMWEARGNLNAYLMDTGLNPLVNLPTTPIAMSIGNTGSASSFEVREGHGDFFQIDGRVWGIWRGMLGGAYSAAPSPMWGLPLEWNASSASSRGWAEVVGVRWDSGMIEANVAGAWLSWDKAAGKDITGVMGGKLAGTYDPSFWQAGMNGARIETNRFLEMAGAIAGTPNTALLQALNIPFAEIGRTDFTGTDGNLSVAMNDAIFFAYSAGQTPSIWASPDVNGSYTATPIPGQFFTLSNGGGMNVNFVVDGWSDANWKAILSNGSGNIASRNIEFNGACAGRVLSAPMGGSQGAFTGTAAGTARPQ